MFEVLNAVVSTVLKVTTSTAFVKLFKSVAHLLAAVQPALNSQFLHLLCPREQPGHHVF